MPCLTNFQTILDSYSYSTPCPLDQQDITDTVSRRFVLTEFEGAFLSADSWLRWLQPWCRAQVSKLLATNLQGHDTHLT